MGLGARLALALLVGFAVGCDDGEGPAGPDAGPGGDGGGGAPGEVTYYEHVRPILVDQCTMCHTAGGIAPFALETYAQASEVGARVAEVTREGTMPPFLADNSGECNRWSNHPGITAAQIDTLGAWVEGGLLEGDPSTPAPTPRELPSLPRADVTLEMPAEYTIDGSSDDDYRCFVLDTGLTAPAYAVGYDVRPGNPERVHHVITYNPVDDGAAEQARQLDLQDGVEGDGYPCFGGPRVTAPPLTLWAPGTGAVRFPAGTGIELTPGRPVVVQVHYNNLVEGSANTDRTSLDLMTESSAIPASFYLVSDFSLSIPPRMPSVTESHRQRLGGIFASLPVDSVRIYGVMPHMHTLGRSLDVQINRPSGEDECLVDVPRWDFDWQYAYWLEDPVRISGEDAVTITCEYDSTSRDEVTTWGDGTQDEMCLSFVYVSL